MLKEDYCSEEVSKLINEKGFDEACRAYYEDGKFCWVWNDGCSRNTDNPKYVSCPTHQMAMKWLRCKGIYIEIDVLGKTNIKYGFTILKLNEGEIYSDDKIYTTYEETVDAALKYCLTELI